jgi:hypothetical protein
MLHLRMQSQLLARHESRLRAKHRKIDQFFVPMGSAKICKRLMEFEKGLVLFCPTLTPLLAHVVTRPSASQYHCKIDRLIAQNAEQIWLYEVANQGATETFFSFKPPEE